MEDCIFSQDTVVCFSPLLLTDCLLLFKIVVFLISFFFFFQISVGFSPLTQAAQATHVWMFVFCRCFVVVVVL